MKDGGRRMRIGMVQLARARGKRGTDRECQKTRRSFSTDGWNQVSPMASILVDALCLRYNDILRRELFVAMDRIIDVAANDTGKNVQFFTMRQVSPNTIALSRKPHSRVLPAPKRSSLLTCFQVERE